MYILAVLIYGGEQKDYMCADPSGRAVWIRGRSLAGIADWNPAGGMDECVL